MAERVIAVCRACRHPYAARAVESDVVLPTTDGKCVCGNDEFAWSVENESIDGETVTEPNA